MNLKNVRIAAGFQGKQVAIHLRKIIDRRIEPGLYCKMEAGLCLPTPAQFRIICQLLKAEPASIYARQEVDFGIGTSWPPKAPSKPTDPDIYKLTVRLPLSLASGLSAKLKRNGYPSIKAFICDCIRKLK